MGALWQWWRHQLCWKHRLNLSQTFYFKVSLQAHKKVHKEPLWLIFSPHLKHFKWIWKVTKWETVYSFSQNEWFWCYNYRSLARPAWLVVVNWPAEHKQASRWLMLTETWRYLGITLYAWASARLGLRCRSYEEWHKKEKTNKQINICHLNCCCTRQCNNVWCVTGIIYTHQHI